MTQDHDQQGCVLLHSCINPLYEFRNHPLTLTLMEALTVLTAVVSACLAVQQWMAEQECKEVTLRELKKTVSRVCDLLVPLQDRIASTEESSPPTRSLLTPSVVACLQDLGETFMLTRDHLAIWQEKRKAKTVLLNFLSPSQITDQLREDERRLFQRLTILSFSLQLATLPELQAAPPPYTAQDSQSTSPLDCISSPEAKRFWKEAIGDDVHCVPGEEFCVAISQWLKVELDQTTRDTMLLHVDEYAVGGVTPSSFGRFVGSKPMRDTIAALHPMSEPDKFEEKNIDMTVKPMIVWIDDRPANNQYESEYARELGIVTITLLSTASAKAWIEANEGLLRNADRANRLRFISDNARFEHGPGSRERDFMNLSAGENILRYLRGRQYRAPVLIYCGASIAKTRYVQAFENAGSTVSSGVCLAFIDALHKGVVDDTAWKGFYMYKTRLSANSLVYLYGATWHVINSLLSVHVDITPSPESVAAGTSLCYKRSKFCVRLGVLVYLMDNMLTSSWPFPLLVATSLLSYLTFKHFEPSSLPSVIFLLGLVPGVFSIPLHQAFSGTIGLFLVPLVSWVSYVALLLFWTASYRLSPFHPLSRFPGPVLGKLTKVWSAWITWKGRRHIYIKDLHDFYGDVVRIGPNELSIRHPHVVQSVLGSPALPKGPSYDNRDQGGVSPLLFVKDLAEHAKRRKAWMHGFSTAALKGYQELIIENTQTLMETFRRRESEVVDISQWMNYFAFDSMGDMAFGHKFGLMNDGRDAHGYYHLVETGMRLATVLANIPWAIPFLRRLPGPASVTDKMRQFGRENVIRRMQSTSPQRDLFHCLLNEGDNEDDRPSIGEVAADGVLAVVAGSDTTATALSNLCNEALRLLPPILSGPQRTVPAGTEKMIGPFLIPSGTHIIIHTYSLHRDPRCFAPFPDTWWPERWLSDECRQIYEKPPQDQLPFALDHTTFIPFSYGPAKCVGKTLAIQEIRAVVCSMMQAFDMDGAHGYHEDLQSWEQCLQDGFVTIRGPLRVSLRSRR
ncbi:hypothetical protein JAAARDRAFT_79518 [Jaapia argillacea MUCL 33604]|uniref:Uncharacterized protein n=1 Tax=Jaapia argillacea MUCL 33604 TaxID=933084 RepID=A0A067PQA3_9AGAM|nr:hypothetical protein JAAARDRAFT_79518 [Jaapia argillacea MUCL 33604]